MNFQPAKLLWAVWALTMVTPLWAQKTAPLQVSKSVTESCRNASFRTVPALPFRVGDSIPFSIVIGLKNFDFDQNTQVVVTPEVHYRNKAVALQPMRFKALANRNLNPELWEDTVMAGLARRGENLFEHAVQVPYEEGIESATLEARFTVIEGKTSRELPLVRISSAGFSSFARFLEPTLELMDLDYEKEKLCIKEIHTINFPAGRYEVGDALNQGAFQHLMATLQSPREILEIKITGSASPEGESTNNENLAYKRMENLSKTIVRELLGRKQNAMASSEVFADGFVTTRWVQQTWDSIVPMLSGLRSSNAPKIKAALLAAEGQEAKKKAAEKFSADYQRMVNDWFPAMRSCRVEILSTPSDQSIMNDLKAFAKGSTKNQWPATRMIQMALAAESEQTSMELYRKAATWYPEDYRAHFKLGMLHYRNNRLTEAENRFQQAVILNPKSAESKNNLGATLSQLNRFGEAMSLFKAAAVQGRPSSINQSYVAARLGHFSDALETMDQEPSHNRALCQIGAGQAYEAIATLQAIEPRQALTAYLTAIAATRINDIALVCEQIRVAIQADLTMREWAKKEPDFHPYRTNAQFREAIKLPPDSQRVGND
ncbi:MAG: tetratricopeptide repeat protein [Bacteroidia bacterium]